MVILITQCIDNLRFIRILPDVNMDICNFIMMRLIGDRLHSPSNQQPATSNHQPPTIND
jgi:hypothetical protein